MITDGEKWHYLPVKSLFLLLRRTTSKHLGDFYCLNCLRSYRTEHYNICKNHAYFYVEIPKEDNKILKYNHGEKSMKVPFIIYADLEPLHEKNSTCYNNPEKWSRTKINKHAPSGYSLFTQCSFDETINETDCHWGKDEGQFECLGENAEKCVTFSISIKKEIDNGKTITYKLMFIDSFRFIFNLIIKVC